MPHADSESSTSGEGSPTVEQAERQVLGESNYQKAEVVHRFADTHSWFHPLLAVAAIVIILGIVVFIIRYKREKKVHE